MKGWANKKGIIDRAPWWNLTLSALFYWWMSTLIRGQDCPSRLHLYSRSSPCDHFHKRPALVTTTFVKPRLNCDLIFLMKSSRKRPRPLLVLSNWFFPLFLSSRKRPDSESYSYKSTLYEIVHCTNGSFIKILGLFWPKKRLAGYQI